MKKTFVFCCLMLSLSAFALENGSPSEKGFFARALTNFVVHIGRARVLEAEDRKVMSDAMSAALSQGFAAFSKGVGSVPSWFNAKQFKK